MKIDLPPDVLKSLPQPSSDDGLVRVTVALKIDSDGSANLVQVGDTPVSEKDDESPAEDSAEGTEETPGQPSGTAQEDAYLGSASQQLAKL